MCLTHSDGEAVETVIGLSPPSVEDRKIQSAVKHYFLAAGPGGLHRPPRIVQPEIDPLHEAAREIYIVIFDEEHLAGKPRVTHQTGDLLQNLLSRIIARMSFAGEDELNRSLRVVDQRSEHLYVLKDEVGAFIGGEAARKTDRQGIQT